MLMDQQTFFDVDPVAAPAVHEAPGEPIADREAPSSSIDAVHLPGRGSVGVVVGEWKTVPYALFSSWSARMQLTYCANRDDDSAARAHDPEWAAFYRQRAADYRVEAGLGETDILSKDVSS